MLADKNRAIELTCDGVRFFIRKRHVHQWRTDLLLEVNEKSFLLGRLEGGMTRGEVKELAQRWIQEHEKRWRG